jgi:uncharacterized membrane protein YfcA
MEFQLLPLELSLWTAVGLVVLSFFTSMLTAGAGIGVGVLMLSVMASVLPAIAVIPVHGVVQLGSNSGRAVLLRKSLNKQIFGYFTAGAILGALIGGQMYLNLPAVVLQAVLGIFILAIVWLPKPQRRAISAKAYSVVGLVSTFLTMFLGGTGPFVAAFLPPTQYGKQQTVATLACCMVVQHGFKILVFTVLGFSYAAWLPLLAAMIGAGFAGTLVGRAVLMKLPEKIFAIMFKTVLTLLGIRLLYHAAAATL